MVEFASPSITINGTTITNNGINNGFIICYDTNGNYKWYKKISGSGDIDLTSITESSKGIVVSVNYVKDITIDGNTISNAGYQDSVLIALSTNGTYQWNKTIGGVGTEEISKVITDNEDNIIAVGGFGSELKFGANTITPTKPDDEEMGDANAIMLKFSSTNGEYISNYTFGSKYRDQKLTSAVASADGGVILSGWYYNNNIDFDGDGVYDVTETGNRNDGIIVKLND